MKKSLKQIRMERLELETRHFLSTLRYICRLAKLGGNENHIKAETEVIFG